MLTRNSLNKKNLSRTAVCVMSLCGAITPYSKTPINSPTTLSDACPPFTTFLPTNTNTIQLSYHTPPAKMTSDKILDTQADILPNTMTAHPETPVSSPRLSSPRKTHRGKKVYNRVADSHHLEGIDHILPSGAFDRSPQDLGGKNKQHQTVPQESRDNVEHQHHHHGVAEGVVREGL